MTTHDAGSPERPDHAGDLLSGHLDGELDPALDAWVVDHLDRCAPCRGEAAALFAARHALRGLPSLDGSTFVDGVVARRHRLLRVGAGFVAVVGLTLGVTAMQAAVHHPSVRPDTEALAAAHVGMGAAGDDHAEAPMPGLRPVAAAGSGYAAPPGLIGSTVSLSRQAVFDGDDLTAVVYEDGGIRVSVFQQPGTLDWQSLPDGEFIDLDARRVWLDPGRPVVAVTEVGDLVVSVVSDDRGAVLTVLGGFPERRRESAWERVHDACQRFTQVFAFGR